MKINTGRNMSRDYYTRNYHYYVYKNNDIKQLTLYGKKP